MAGGSNGSDGHLHDPGDDIFEKPASIFLSALHILKEALRRGGLGEASFSHTGTANGNDGYGWSVPWHAAFVKEVGVCQWSGSSLGFRDGEQTRNTESR